MSPSPEAKSAENGGAKKEEEARMVDQVEVEDVFVTPVTPKGKGKQKVPQTPTDTRPIPETPATETDPFTTTGTTPFTDTKHAPPSYRHLGIPPPLYLHIPLWVRAYESAPLPFDSKPGDDEDGGSPVRGKSRTKKHVTIVDTEASRAVQSQVDLESCSEEPNTKSPESSGETSQAETDAGAERYVARVEREAAEAIKSKFNLKSCSEEPNTEPPESSGETSEAKTDAERPNSPVDESIFD